MARHPTTWARNLEGLGSARPADPDARVPLVQFYAALEREAAQRGMRAWLRDTGQSGPEQLDALGLMVAASETLGSALAVIERYHRVFAEGERLVFTRTSTQLSVCYRPWGPPRQAHDLLALLFVRDLGCWLPARAEVLQRSIDLRLRQRRTPDLVEALGSQVRFGQSHDEVVFPLGALSRTLRGHDPGVSKFLARYLDERLERLAPESAARLTQGGIERLLASAVPATLGAVAKSLGLSARTLQRRLASEGQSFDELLDETRRARALSLLSTRASLAEVAFALGYADQSSFQRAFRRWTRQTPRAWRLEHFG
ncbi:MAG: helix-turn-helix domain-containing protein [Myxococcaceae bacterium]